MTFSLVVPIFVYFAGQCKLDLSEIVKRGGEVWWNRDLFIKGVRYKWQDLHFLSVILNTLLETKIKGSQSGAFYNQIMKVMNEA